MTTTHTAEIEDPVTGQLITLSASTEAALEDLISDTFDIAAAEDSR